MLNFVEEKLLAQGGDDNINIIKFNPWLVNNDETLLREFFKSMTRRLDDKTREIFEKYGDDIKSEVLGVSITSGNLVGYEKDWNINGEKVQLSVEKQ